MSRPCELGALKVRNLIGKNALLPLELVDDCIARIEKVNPTVNAMVVTSLERAREETKNAKVRREGGTGRR